MGIRPIGKPIFRDQLLERGVVGALVDSRVGVPADEQQLKDQHREAEAVVVLGADDAAEGLVLQFRRRVVGDADVAEVVFAVGADLERVAIDHRHHRIGIHEQIGLIHIADDHSRLMDRIKGSGAVKGGMDQEFPICRREVQFPMGGGIECPL